MFRFDNTISKRLTVYKAVPVFYP